MKVLNVVGARPNFVKIAPLMAEMWIHQGILPLLVHTGQHYEAEMSDSFFRDLDIPRPDINLGVGPAGPTEQVAEMMLRLEPVMIKEKPDVVVVVGDVNSTLAGAMTAVKLGIPVAHVEAGLRSFDRTMPEELNRLVTDAVSDLLFVSEPSGVLNLLREVRVRNQIFLVGNVMIDTLLRFLPLACRSTTLLELGLAENHGHARRYRYAVLTLHRPSNVDCLETLERIWKPLQELSREIRIVFPVHPRTRKRLLELGWDGLAARSPADNPVGMQITPPLSYLRFLHLQREAAMVITDSGGIQEETTVLGVPCLTIRENTERPATVMEGTNVVVGLNPERILEEAGKVLSGKGKHGQTPKLWDGLAAQRIVKILYDHYGPRAKQYRRPMARARSAYLPTLTAN